MAVNPLENPAPGMDRSTPTEQTKNKYGYFCFEATKEIYNNSFQMKWTSILPTISCVVFPIFLAIAAAEAVVNLVANLFLALANRLAGPINIPAPVNNDTKNPEEVDTQNNGVPPQSPTVNPSPEQSQDRQTENDTTEEPQNPTTAIGSDATATLVLNRVFNGAQTTVQTVRNWFNSKLTTASETKPVVEEPASNTTAEGETQQGNAPTVEGTDPLQQPPETETNEEPLDVDPAASEEEAVDSSRPTGAFTRAFLKAPSSDTRTVSFRGLTNLARFKTLQDLVPTRPTLVPPQSEETIDDTSDELANLADANNAQRASQSITEEPQTVVETSDPQTIVEVPPQTVVETSDPESVMGKVD